MTDFDTFFAKFKQSPAWKQMTETVEASPWHREANVAVHTEMTLEQYRTRFEPIRMPEQNKIAKFALLFHDVGKPAAEEVLEKKDGSGEMYRRYAGHEQDSSVAFMEEYVRNADLRAILTVQESRMVRWIIEHHLPYGLKQADKVNGLRLAMKITLGDMEETFYDCLRSDSAGRISDDHAQKLANVEEWIENFKKIPLVLDFTNGTAAKRTMCILIGPSGSGKSTWTAKHQKPGDIVLSLDTMRLDFLAKSGVQHDTYADEGALYAHAWEYATAKEAAFTKHILATTKELMTSATGDLVFIDNVNASRKRRAQWVQLGRAHGCKIVAVEFWNTLEVLAARQKTRGDKSVPYNAVKQQQYSVTCAWLGDECDEVQVVVGEQS